MPETQKREWQQINPVCMPLEPFVWQPERSPVNTRFLEFALPKSADILTEAAEADVLLAMSSYHRAVSNIGSLSKSLYGAVYCLSYLPIGARFLSGIDAIVDTQSNYELFQRLSFYEIEDKAEVGKFLNRSPELIDLLLEARICIERFWGPMPSVILRMVEEPDSSSESELFATVITGLPADEALRRLSSFDNEWWIENSVKALGKLNFDVERR